MEGDIPLPHMTIPSSGGLAARRNNSKSVRGALDRPPLETGVYFFHSKFCEPLTFSVISFRLRAMRRSNPNPPQKYA